MRFRSTKLVPPPGFAAGMALVLFLLGHLGVAQQKYSPFVEQRADQFWDVGVCAMSQDHLEKHGVPYGSIKQMVVRDCKLNGRGYIDAAAFNQGVNQFSALQTLVIQDNQTPPAIFDRLEYLPKLQEIILNRAGLFELPPTIGEIDQLKALDLAENQLTTLPLSILDLHQLEYLDLSQNSLSFLPSKLHELDSLTYLNLSGNLFATVPLNLAELSHLRVLYLEDNGYTYLPVQVGELVELEELHLGGNSLSALPASLEQLDSLRVLDLRNNNFVTAPEVLFKLDSLEELYLAGNPLSEPDRMRLQDHFVKIRARVYY